MVRSTLLHVSLRGALRAILGGLLVRLFFFVFNPMFSSSKRPPETKASLSQGFQTMRNSILLTIFLQDHGIYCSETDFGPILAPFWIELSKYLSECIRIEWKSNILNIYDTRSIARASFHDFTPPPKSRNFHGFQNLSCSSRRCFLDHSIFI